MLTTIYNPSAKWLGGVIVPLVITVYAGSVLVAGRAAFRGRNGGVLELTGSDAVLFAVCVTSLAVAIHFFQYWGNTERLSDYAPIGAGAGLLGFVIILGYLVARQFLNFV